MVHTGLKKVELALNILPSSFSRLLSLHAPYSNTAKLVASNFSNLPLWALLTQYTPPILTLQLKTKTYSSVLYFRLIIL